MTLGVRKLVVGVAVAAVILLANALVLAHWLAKIGLVGWATSVREAYLTGTAVTVILALLVLLTPGREVIGRCSGLVRRCPVCDHLLLRKGRYCPACGSRVQESGPSG